MILTSFNLDDSKNKTYENALEEDCNLTLIVENKGDCPIHLYEWDATLGGQLETIIQAGETYSVNTEDETIWRATNGDFNNLLYDENIIATFCPEETWVTFPVYCNPPMTSWDFDCDSGRKVEIVGEGVQNDVPHSLYFANSSNIYKTVVEVVYKGANPGSQIVVFDNDGNPFSAYREVVPGGSSNVWVYRATMPGTPSASIYNTTEQGSAQSMVAYLFRENVAASQQSGVFTYLSGYNNLETLTFDIPAAAKERDIILTVPISELTDDGRYLMLEASAGGISNQTFVYGPSSTLGCCMDLIEVVLNDVPGTATQVTLNIDTRNNQNGQTVNGQSYVLAGAVEVDAECVESCLDGACGTVCELNDHGPSDESASEDRLIWLKFPSEVDTIREYSVVAGSSQFVENEDGSALITGIAEQVDNPTFKWEYHVKLINKRSWAEWSALGRDYKADVSGTNHTFWSYYEVDNTDSYFTGLEGHAGESLTITHAPTSYEFGFQVGLGANVKNAEYGLSGWFNISGSYSGGGDFNGNLENCNNGEVCSTGGTIRYDETDCEAFDPNTIVSIEDATGDSGNQYGASCCESGEKPQKLRLIYNGQTCSQSTTTQDDDKWSCTGSLNGANSVYVVASEDEDGGGDIYFQGQINLLDTFLVDATLAGEDKFSSWTYLNIYSSQGGSVLQTIGIHTSCSAPLITGETWGAVQLDDIVFEDGTTCSAMSTNPDCCDSGNDPQKLFLEYNGQSCASSTTTQDDGKWSCTGNVNNASSVYIVASEDEDGGGDIYFQGMVDLNETFVADANLAGEDKFSSWTYLNIYASQGGALLQTIGIHTSCSAPLIVGETWGALELKSVIFDDGTACGNSNTIEYVWLKSTNGCPDNLSQAIPGATFESYNPSFISATTWYVRWANVIDCDGNQIWEKSNCVKKEVTGGNTCPADITIDCTESTDPSNTGFPILNCASNLVSSPIVEWDLDACANYSDAYSYLEFTPNYLNTGNCVSADASIVYRNNPNTNFHSCVTGVNGIGKGACFSADNNSSATFNDKAIRFSVTLDPTENAQLTALKFYEVAPMEVIWNGTDNQGDNNFPKKYAIRVKKGGSTIFQQTGISTTYNWTLETFDFSSDPAFAITSPTTFDFELIAYDIQSNGGNKSVWDLDNISIEASCATSGANTATNATYEDEVSGDCPKEITRTWSLDVPSNCNDILVEYSGECDDPEDSLYPTILEGFISNATNVAPTNGPSYASCANDIICMNSLYNSWDFTITSQSAYTFNNIVADFLYPIYEPTAGGSANSTSCNTTFTFTVSFFLNGSLVDTKSGSFPSDVITSMNVAPSTPIATNAGDQIKVLIEGNPVSNSCALFELAGLRYKGCETPSSQTLTCTQIITVEDNNTPTFSNLPADLSVNCEDNPAVVAPDFADECDDDLEIIFEEELQAGVCDDSYSILRKWTATDNCGNSTTATQLVTYSDTTDPVFSDLPFNMTVECDSVFAPSPVANDNCDVDVNIILNDEFTTALSCTDNYTITRVWTATDNCGNQATLTQVATIQDTQDPTISVPADQTVSCDAIPAIPTPIVNDNCDTDVLVNFNEAFVPGTCDNSFTLIRTWTADDNCGNSATATQTITVIDSDGPEILDAPADQIVECDAYTAAPILTIQDNCDASATISLQEEIAAGTCDDNYIVTRTWTAIDACGNTTTAIQVVTVVDTQNPTLAGIPADTIVQCDAIPTPASPTASDNCDNDVDISYQEVSTQTTDGSCTDNSYTLTRIWTATDNCGNEDIRQQVITVEDTTDPSLGNLPADDTVECDAVPAPATLTAEDNCDADVAISFSENSTKTNDGSCTDDTYVITRTWTATDNCGNTDTYTQTINVQDTTDPILANIPVDITINSLPAPAVATPTATDNCDGDVDIIFEETSGEGCSYEIIRTWTATDNCGNQDVQTQTITVEIDPQAGTLSIDDQLVCLAPAGNGNISATPNGDANVPVGFDVIYVLTKGNGLVIEQVNSTPNFTALTAGDYTIHTLLYVSDSNDPNFLDLSSIVFGTTTGFDVNALLQQGGGLLCGSLDVAGARVVVDNCDAKIGNFVFEDLNANGIQDFGESGIGGVIVNLEGTTADGEVVFASQMTNPDGSYSFDNLAPGDYKLTFIKPIGYEATYANEGSNDAADSDADPISGMTVFENLVSGEDNDTYDAGFYKTGKIGDMVFADTNANGIMDLGEAGIPNVQVILTGTTGNGTSITLNTTTDADGKYSFDGLIPGSYKLTFATPTGFVTTYPNEGGNDAADSDVDPATSMTDFEDLESGEENLTYDAGYYEYAKIGNFVFEDTNANGIQDFGENGIPNVEVLLTGTTGNGTAVSLTTTTDGNGIYVFDNLIPGDYKLTFTSPTDFKATYANEGGDDNSDSDADPISGMTVFENLESGEDNDTYDAGFFKAGKIGDMVFNDKNANGIMDFGEEGIAGVEVILTGITGNGTTVNLTTTTDADGKYIFDDLAPGTYKLTFTTPAGFVTTYLDEGGNDNSDSDVDPATGMTEFVTIGSGEENLTLDAGYYEPAKIGDMAFVDANGNGIMDAGEAGIQFVSVVLEGFTGNNTPVTLTTQTDANGKYSFDNLTPGAYKLTFTANPLYQITNKDVGGDDALDSDIDPATGMTDFEFLESGETNLTYDAGYYVYGKIGDFVWLDCNKDGMQSPGEEGIEGVKLNLFGTNGFGFPVQAMATTDADGKYEFDGLMPGVYLITLELSTAPAGLAFTTPNQGDDSFDSDFVGGATANITVSSGSIINDIDGGLIDDEAPIFSGVPTDETVECDAIPAPASPTATDNLDLDVDISFAEVSTQSGNTSDCQNNTFTITRTWTATDDCGNVSTATQVITVEDTTDPILIDFPADLTVECSAIPIKANPTASDNCDVDVEITFNEIIVDGICTDNYTIERTWTATDNCGNDVSQTQIITVQDTTDPELIGVPDDVTIECSFVPGPAAPQVIDNCDNDVDISFNEVKTDGTCEDNYILTRTWIATDNCGNTDTKVQVITVQDTTDPNIYDIPANVTVECDAIPAVSTAPFANDNCDDDVAITFAQEIIAGTCDDNYTIERTWTATDNCGNDIAQTQIITVQDTTDPILSGVPANETVECDAVPNQAYPTASDNCDNDVDIAYEEVRTDGSCINNYTLTRTWTATDNCGNTDVQVQVVTVQDTTDPELIGVPADVTVECDLVPTPATPEAIDNCDADVTIDYVEVRTDGACVDTYTLTRTWTATDNCGNTDVQVQVIEVQDTTDPNIYDIPANVTVECDAVPAPSTAPFGNDNCDDDVAITFAEVKVDGQCEDNYTLERTWTATDNCGNDISQTQIITVQDTTDPELIGVPANVTVECDLVPTPAAPQAIDNCDADVDIVFNEVKTDGQCEDNYILTRTWTASDNCGNQDVKIQYILVQDTNAPNIYDIPANVTVECNAIPLPSTAPFANDNCDVDVAITFNEVKIDGNCADNYSLERTWTATDNCGNTDSGTQIITVQDTTDPILSGVPADETVECSAVPAAAQPTATDNCDADVTILLQETLTSGSCTDNYTITRTWTATDNCGNTDIAIQVITVQDTTDPILAGVPTDVTVECDAVPAPAIPTASDNCDVDVNIAFEVEIVPGTCPDSYTMIRTWTATDNCGNEDIQIQNITVQDTTDPTLIGVPANVTVECDAVPTLANPTAADNCDPNPIVSFNEVKIDGACIDSYILERTWTATDACGNDYSETQIITVQDTTDPVMTGIPADVTVECDLVPVPAQPFVNDNCDVDVDIDYSEVRTDGSCIDNYTLTRTWIATDNCGNETTQVQIITVQDTTDPALYGVPTNITVQCDAIPLPASPTANDNCDTDVDISFLENITPGACTDNYTITRVWTATDNCGNQTFGVQTITVEDTVDPILSGVPGNVTVECDAIPTLAQPTATDNCDTDVAITFNEVKIDGSCADNYTLERTWIATDNCGNTDIKTQIITVQDTTDPILAGVPADVTVECDAVPAVAQPTATDNCDADVNIAYNEVRTDGTCLDTYTLTRTWTAMDNCGNTDIQVQVIEVQDTSDPILSGVPADATIDCNNIPAPAQPIATDNCDVDVTIIFDEILTDGSCADNFTITRTWTATDNCGNSISQTQTLTVQDIIDPIISGVPADVTVECDAVPAPAQPVATDNCDTNVDLDFTEIQTDGSCTDNYTLTRTWIATDNCGNTTTEIQVITVEDTTDPILSEIPADATVECDAVPAPVTPTATDNCDVDVTIEFVEVQIDGDCTDNYTIVRTYIATDNCGNQDFGVQIITVEDTTPPTISGVPADLITECDAVPAAPAAGTIIVADNCDTDVAATYSEIIQPGGCADSYTIKRIWTATDNCGNITVATQNITVSDVTPPTLSGVPADTQVDCNSVPAAPTPGAVTATDNCDVNVYIQYFEELIDGACDDSYVLKRTWTATDNCGNETQATQIITVGDATGPVLAGVPADLDVECNNIPAPANPTATDDCDTDVDISYEEITTPGACENSYILTRTWVATDNCGNETVGIQNITVQDTQQPILAGIPTDTSADCNSIPAPPANVTATDNCDTDVTIDFSETSAPGACANSTIITRTWTATDNCGNSISASQTISVGDASAPILSNLPGNVTVECDNIPLPETVTATSDCLPNIQVDFVETIIDGACVNGYTIERTWTTNAGCGTAVSHTQIITVQDTTDPILIDVPADATVDCNSISTPVQPIATDNCDTDVDIDFNETSVPDGCGYILTRTWTATDDCGNATEASQIITVTADQPVLSDTPADITVECNNIPTAATITASSDCDPNIVVWFTENIIAGSCEDNYTIERIWTVDLACGGNDVSHTQTITVQDTQNPILAGIPAAINVGCGNVPAPAQPIATDNCDTDVDIIFSEAQAPLPCGYELTRTWTAVDNCGNETSASQIITVEDNEDPILIGIPADATADCNNIPTVTANVTVTDNCSTNITIDFVETTTPGACTNAYTLTRTWTATDDCGNSVSASQNISVGDNTPPTLIDVPANTTVECASISGAPYVGASDNCDFDVEVILSEVETPLACGYLITRTWTAIDDCGNETTATQEVTVTDTEVPSLWEIPADLTVDCGNIPAIDQGVGVLDNCDPDATLDFIESYIAGDCADNYTIVRTWTATDNCGNTISDSQNITVQDTQAPVLAGVPTDLTVDCNNVPTAAQPVATDNCDSSVDIDFDEVSVANGCGYILTRTWIATDNCGNETEASQTITVTADAPILSTAPANVTVECNDIPVAAIVTAQSNCAGTVQVDFVENIISGACENSYTIERIWSVASGCGNGITHTQLITVEDTQSPILAGIPANLNVACGNIPAPANPVATDNCDTDVDISFSEIENPLSCGYELIRTWTATDNCGNETSASQTITVQDNEDPILIGVPADETVNCGTVPTPATVTATDNCDNDVEVSFSETSVVDGCQTIITRTWTAIDDCGNETSDSQTITVNADPATLSAMPADITVECSNIPVSADISAFDGCTGNPIVVDFVENIIPGACENSFTIERTWSVASGCGNGVSHTQLVTVEDTTNPTLIGVPADTNVECGMIPTTPIITGTDNCDTDVEITFNEVETPAACGYILTRTWTATDNCGNSVSASQIINVGDNTPPVVAGIPANLTVECNDIPAVANNPIATDNCDVDVEISFSETNTPGACVDSYTLTRTWTATDDCGNTTEGVQTIFVQDITNPTLIGVPNNLTVDLTIGQTIPTAPILIGTDNCDTDVDITFEENQTGSGCAYTLERTWTATDNCGNSVSATQTIEVIGGLNVTETHVDASCGENNGSIDLTVSGGVAPITFAWSNGVGNIEDQTGLAPGIYEVTITDATGCAANLSIEILGTGILQADIAATMVSCYDGNDGSINVTMVNGLAPFTYDWTNGIGNIPNPTNLTAGSYNVTITDANGCSASTGANVNQPQELIVTIDSNGGGCAGGLGSATANVDGGNMPYQYAWSNGGTTSTISNLTEGTYTVVITDNNGCTIEDEVSIASSSNLIVSIDKTDVSCYLGTDGTATANVMGGQPIYTYLWSNGETNATIINLEAGSYTVTITDETGCMGIQTIQIISPPELQLTTVATEVTPIGNDGTATVTATGGTLPYEYIWSNGQTTPTATGLSVGNYAVTVIDDNGCFAVDQIEVTAVTPTGDVNIGDYVWFDTNRDGIQDIDEVGFNNVMVKLLTTGQDGLFGTLDDEIVAIETTSNNPSLTGAGYYLFENVAAGTYQIEFMLSSLPNDYMIALANQGMDDNLDSDANPLTGRTSTFTVVAGQMDDLSFDAGVHPECNNVTTGGAIEATQTVCAGETPDLLVNSIYPTGGGGDLEYIWLVNTTGSPFSNNDPTWTIIQGATDEFYQPGPVFTNTYFVRCARRSGCTDYTGESNIVPILVTPLPTVEIEQAPTSLCLSESTSFQAAFAGATATYLWDFGTGASPQTSTQRNVYNLTYSSTGTKTVTLTVENMGCSLSTTYEFEVTDCLNGFVFTNFVAQPEPSGTEVLLNWTTQYEVNESRFFLEHSKNGDDFQTFELRNANGSAQQINSYQAIHAEPYYGVNYYRIKYVDTNGQSTYSKVEVVVFDNGTRDIHVYPNPVIDFTYVEFLTELREDATIEVVDMTGRVLSTQVVADGFRTYRVNLADYPAGTYLIWVRYNDYRKDVERVVKITE